MAVSAFQNTPNNSDFARVAENDGSVPAGVIRSAGNQVKPLADGYGRLFVNAIPYPNPLPVEHQVTAGTSAAFASLLISATPAQLVVVSGYNADPANDLYVQLFNLAALPPGVANPLVIIPVPSGQPFSYSIPVSFSVGICIGISSTPFTFTSATQLASMVAIYKAAS